MPVTENSSTPESSSSPAPIIHVIACGVLSIDLTHIAKELALDIQTTYLPGGLHNDPKELRRRLQRTIDEVSAEGKATQIAVGYGVCGRGTVDLRARQIPLVIPRVHDCIALFLGSDAAYRQQFAKYPGTFYVSAGWIREKSQPSGSSCGESGHSAATPGRRDDAEHRRLVEAYGEEDAAAVEYFLTSWQRNYQRAAFIDTGAAEHQRYARLAQEMAQRYGWRYEALEGSGALLKKMLLCRASDAEVLWVPPHHVTTYDPANRGLSAVPVWKAERQGDQSDDGDQVIEIGGTQEETGGERARLGLGIDAGGTYTDVVLYDFATDRVLQKAKALTTKWDYTLGISEALDRLDPSRLAEVDLVAVSTTLATNAIVEGQGQKVGLLLMPPDARFAEKDVTHRPMAVVRGRMSVTGEEQEPIDAEQVQRIARRLVEKDHVQAFAVTGYASHANPNHEIEIRRIVEEATGLPVTCGHDVSTQLDYTVRAQTAALNSRIIPILVNFLEHADRCLRDRGITAPLMVVRSDGSLMNVQTARHRPIETILSGPAASVAGAQYLAKAPTAFVVDVGGTTTDTALVTQGAVRTAREGARVGDWQTHVQALDMRTCGLGGDSLIAYARRELRIGPRRVSPIAWAAARHPGISACFEWIENHLDRYVLFPELMDIYVLDCRPDDASLSERERRIVRALETRPYSGHELTVRVQEHWADTLNLERLERDHTVLRCGLTPTDLLHASGQFVRWDSAAATRMVKLMSAALETRPERFTTKVMDLITRRLAMEILKKQLDDETDGDSLERSAACKAVLNNWMSGGSTNYHVRIRLKHPIIGVGAPVGHFLPAAAKLLETHAILPENGDVANAIGAITSSVVIRRQVEISPDICGRYAVYGLEGAPTFAELADAQKAAMESLREQVSAAARSAGTRQTRIRFAIHDNVAPLAEGGQIFIAQTIDATLTGRPDLRMVGNGATAT